MSGAVHFAFRVGCWRLRNVRHGTIWLSTLVASAPVPREAHSDIALRNESGKHTPACTRVSEAGVHFANDI